MSELGPRAELQSEPEKTGDVILDAVNPIIESNSKELEAQGVDMEKSRALIKEMLVEAFEAGVQRMEE